MTKNEEREIIRQYVCALLSDNSNSDGTLSKEFLRDVKIPRLFNIAEMLLEEERKRYD